MMDFACLKRPNYRRDNNSLEFVFMLDETMLNDLIRGFSREEVARIYLS